MALYFSDPTLLKGCAHVKQVDKGHGRLEIRQCYVTDKIHWLEGRKDWKGLQTIACIEAVRTIKGVASRETRYFISGLPADPNVIL